MPPIRSPFRRKPDVGLRATKLPNNVHTADLVRQATPEVRFPEISPVKRAPRQKRPMPNRREWMPTSQD